MQDDIRHEKGEAFHSRSGPVVLVEPNLDLDNGHWGDSVLMLATAAVERGQEVAVVAPRPPTATVLRSLAEMNVQVLDAARVDFLSRGLGWINSWLGQREARRRERGDDIRAANLWLSRVLIDEVVSLRVAHRVAASDGLVVLLTGSSCYIGLASSLSRCPHIRVVHEVHKPVGRRAARAARLVLGSETQVSLICPTPGVAESLSRSRQIGGIHVRPFALRDERLYVSGEERAAERIRRNIGIEDLVIAVVGGWWPAKDVETVIDALLRVGRGVRAIVAGHPVDPSRLRSVARRLGDRLVVIDRPLTRDDLRRIYAVADVSLVSRHLGVVKESGLVLDGIRYGVHLVLSDHDPTASARLEALDYVSVFRAGDSADLASTIDRLRRAGAPRPGPGAANDFGLLSAGEALDAYWSTRPVTAANLRRQVGQQGRRGHAGETA